MSSDTNKRNADLLASDLRLLTTASRLKQFTLIELAEHAGVGGELARSFLRRSKDFELIAVEARDGRGRRKNLWRLRPDRSVRIATRVADVSRAIGWTPVPSEDSPKTWELLRSTVKRLVEGSLNNHERPRVLRRAEMYLASAEMELRDRIALSLPVPAGEQQVVDEARGTIKLLSKVASMSPVLLVALRPKQALRTQFRISLADWTTRMELAALDKNVLALDPKIARDQLRAHGPSGILDMALHTAESESDVDAALAPALAMLYYKPGWDDAINLTFAADIKDRLTSTKVANSPFLITALAATAAAFDIDEVVEPLTELFLSRRRVLNQPPEWRSICRSVFARFARPGRPLHNVNAAAAACHFLLTQGDDPADFPILATAALGAPHASVPSLLHCVGHAMASAQDNLGSMARNLGMALARDDFAPLQQHIDNLIENDKYGLLMLAKLRAPTNKAIELIDSNKVDGRHPFVVAPRPLLAGSLGVSVRTVPLQVKESAGDRLSQMISTDVWSDEPSGMLGALLAHRARHPHDAQPL